MRDADGGPAFRPAAARQRRGVRDGAGDQRRRRRAHEHGHRARVVHPRHGQHAQRQVTGPVLAAVADEGEAGQRGRRGARDPGRGRQPGQHGAGRAQVLQPAEQTGVGVGRHRVEERVEAEVGGPGEGHRPGHVHQRHLDRAPARPGHGVAGAAGWKERAEHGARRIHVLGDHRRAGARDARHHAVAAGGGPSIGDRHMGDDPAAGVPVQQPHRGDGPAHRDEALVDRVGPDRGRQVAAVTPVVHHCPVDAHLREQVLDVGVGPLAGGDRHHLARAGMRAAEPVELHRVGAAHQPQQEAVPGRARRPAGRRP